MKSMGSPELRPLAGGGGGKQQAADKCEDERLFVSPVTSSACKRAGRAQKTHRNLATAAAAPGAAGPSHGRLLGVRAGSACGGHLLLAMAFLLTAIDFQRSATLVGAEAGSVAEQREAKAALEAELGALLQQHEAQDANSKLLSEAIISRWMLGNLSETATTSGNLNLNGFAGDSSSSLDGSGGGAGEQQQSPSSAGAGLDLELSGPEAARLRRLLSYLHNYELAQARSGAQFPVLPAEQAATIKRASMKMGSYLRQQQQQHGQQRQLNGYNRNTFDFGLGKRPDSSVGAANILRYGDSGGVPGAGQFGKRPSAHRYDFGLGKRVASPAAYPRYDFGLGKRVPNRIRYDFGLG